MKKQNVRTLSLIVCTFTYLLIGAAVFDALESENEARTLHLLSNMTVIIKGKYNISDYDYQLMETMVLKSVPFRAGNQWKFAGAFYYAITVLTTIGYGHSTPRTIGGKVFTMAYALVGIPLGLVMFQSIGERVNRVSSVSIRCLRKLAGARRPDATEMNLICAVFTLSVLVITGGAAAFSSQEGWTYFNSVYYCFITLTTIGFGDMVSLQQANALNRQPEYVAFALVFILFGLAIVAASLNLLVLRFVTMNTEDERRDEVEAIQAAQDTVRLEGDVITANGSVIFSPGGRGTSSNRQHMVMSPSDRTPSGLVDCHDCRCPCSFCCFGCCPLVRRSKNRYNMKRRPGRITNLLPHTIAMHPLRQYSMNDASPSLGANQQQTFVGDTV